MARFGVSPEKEQQLIQEMERLCIREDDLEENFIRGSGAGGQKINKTSSCVQLRHKPSGIEVRCQRERSQSLNRFFARRELCAKLEAQIFKKESKRQQEIEKIRRQKRKRSKRAKEKMLQGKHRRSELKRMRGAPGRDDGAILPLTAIAVFVLLIVGLFCFTEISTQTTKEKLRITAGTTACFQREDKGRCR